MPCTKHGSLMVGFVPFYQGPAPRGRSLDKAHVKYKEPEQQRDFMIKYVQGRVEVGGGMDVHTVYEVNGAEKTDTAIQNCLM